MISREHIFPVVVFKCKRGGEYSTVKLSNCENDLCAHVRRRLGWMMMTWWSGLTKYWSFYCIVSYHILMILIFDTYWHHTLVSIINKTEELGVHIPEWCSGLCQPVDKWYKENSLCIEKWMFENRKRMKKKWNTWPSLFLCKVNCQSYWFSTGKD